MRKPSFTTKEAPKWGFHYRMHDHIRYRVWRDDWFGDQFEILGPDNFRDLSRYAEQFNIPMIEHSDDD